MKRLIFPCLLSLCLLVFSRSAVLAAGGTLTLSQYDCELKRGEIFDKSYTMDASSYGGCSVSVNFTPAYKDEYYLYILRRNDQTGVYESYRTVYYGKLKEGAVGTYVVGTTDGQGMRPGEYVMFVLGSNESVPSDPTVLTAFVELKCITSSPQYYAFYYNAADITLSDPDSYSASLNISNYESDRRAGTLFYDNLPARFGLYYEMSDPLQTASVKLVLEKQYNQMPGKYYELSTLSYVLEEEDEHMYVIYDLKDEGDYRATLYNGTGVFMGKVEFSVMKN